VTTRTVALLLALVLAPSAAFAQNCQTPNPPPNNCTVASLPNPATMTNPRTIRLTMSTTTVSGTTSIPDFDQGYIELNSTATVNANRPWTLLIRASAATWTNSGVGSRANKPAADLQWSTALAGPYAALTTTNVQFATGAATNSTVTTLYYRGMLDWTLDKPGGYTLGVTITVSTP